MVARVDSGHSGHPTEAEIAAPGWLPAEQVVHEEGHAVLTPEDLPVIDDGGRHAEARHRSLIIGHGDRGLELLVFYRRRKDEFPDYAFRYLGPFEYSSRVTPPGEGPTRFVLGRLVTAEEAPVPLLPTEADAEPFDPADISDAQEAVSRQIKARRGQRKFRDELLAAYERRCTDRQLECVESGRNWLGDVSEVSP